MSLRAAAWLAWSLAALCVAMFLVDVAVYLATLPVKLPSSWGTGGVSVPLYAMLPFLPFPFVGALIASRRPSNPIGWICLAVGLLWMLNLLTSSYVVYGLRVAAPGSVPYPAAIGSMAEWLGPTAVLLFGTYLILLFPEGKLPSSRWRPVAWLSAAVAVSNVVVTTISPGHLSDLKGVSNPFGLQGYPWLANVVGAIGLLLPLCMLASVLSLLVRYLRSGKEVREQIKWLAFAASVVALGVFLEVVAGTFFSSDAGSIADLLGNLLEDAITMSFAGIPIAIGFAVLKYRLYDIDVIINRALVYGPLSAVLVLIYVGGVVGMQAVVRALTGQESTLAVVASTLAIAALFNPLRRRVQSLVDRRFYMRKYDAAKTLASFGSRLREETDLASLGDEVLAVVRETMQPAYASLWVRPHGTDAKDDVPG
jgi:hypothetical protein